MSDLSMSQSDKSEGLAVRVEQETRGDRNQTIGQVLGGMVVYVSGGQAIINAGSEASSAANDDLTRPELGPNPYKGLLAFRETDGDRFFGRDTQIEQLWHQFCGLHEADEGIRVLPIYGPSGSGKSSLARAGLIPELARQPLPGREQARVAVLVPGSHPLEALATVLARVVTNDPTPVTKSREFRAELSQTNADGNYDGLRRIADVLPDIAISPLIVLVDQLEEIYTLCEDGAERTAFVRGLLCAASDRAKRVSVIVTMRSDFLGETQKYPGLNRLFSTQGFLAPVMNELELREAICKPAAIAGHPLDEGTVGQLIGQTEAREGALPLLQFALSRIWEGLEKGILPAVTLETIGGIGGALAGEAKRVYEGLSVDQQTIARRLFLGLVQLGEGTRDTRRRVVVESLVAQKDSPAEVKLVLEKFTDLSVRLITCAATEEGTETAEVTHEALFDHWQQLQQWLEESRSDLRFQRRLEMAAADWEKMERPDGKLWRSPDLDMLRQYAEHSGNEMTPLEMTFFTASEQAVEKVESERRQQRQLLVRVLSSGLMLTTGAAIFAMHQVQRFERQRVDQLATTAEALLLSEQPLDAKIHAIVSTGVSKSALVQFLRPLPSQLAYASLLNSSQSYISRKRSHIASINSVAFSPNGERRATGSSNRTVQLWDVITGQRIGEPLRGHEGAVNSVAFSPDGKTVVSASRDRTVRLWNAITGQRIGEPLRGHEGAVNSVAFSPDGKTVVSASSDSTLRLWDVTTGGSPGKPLRGHEGAVNSVAFSPDGKTVVSASRDRTVRLWNAITGQPIGKSSMNYEGAVNYVAFSPDGKTIISGNSDSTLRLWDAITGQPIGKSLTGHKASVNYVTFSPDGKTIISASRDRTVRLWDVTTGAPPISKPLTGHEGAVNSVAFSPNGKTIVSGSYDSTLRLWDMATSASIGKPLTGHEGAVNSVAFSPNGETIVSASSDRTVRLWDVTTGAPPISKSLTGHKDVISSVAFSPDGKTIVSVSLDDTMRLWDVTTGAPVGKPLTDHEAGIGSVAFSPNGKTLVSGGYGGIMVRLWNSTTGVSIGSPLTEDYESVFGSVAFSPNGKTIVSASSDSTLRLWDAITGDPIGNQMKDHESSFNSVEIDSVAFSPNSKTIVSGGQNGVQLWNAITGDPIGNPLTDHEAGVGPVSFSPDGKTIVSASSDSTLRLWNISQEKLLQNTCNQLRLYPALMEPETDVEKEAKRTCDRYVWSKEKTSP